MHNLCFASDGMIKSILFEVEDTKSLKGVWKRERQLVKEIIKYIESKGCKDENNSPHYYGFV